MAGRRVGKTTNVDNWSFQENYVERLMDNSAFTAAHPNNTLILAGPARYANLTKDSAGGDEKDLASNLMPIGMIQNMSIGQSRQLQPMQSVGSARTFFSAGKSNVTFNIGRLVVNGNNLLRVMYAQATKNLDNLDLMSFGEPPARSDANESFYLNLDSELFYIPIGLAVLFRSVAHDAVGAFYIELCMFNSWNTGVQAGGNVIMEQVSGLADRIIPIFPDSIVGGPANHPRSEKMAEYGLNESSQRSAPV